MPDLTDTEINITTEQGLRHLLTEGHHVEVLCKGAPFKKGPTWYGVWIMRTVSPESKEKLLVTARTRTTTNDIKVREFKTATGVISFLIGVGFDTANIPLKEGQRTSHVLTGT